MGAVVHPCDKATYRKLKKYRYYAHIERIQQSALQRWSKKLPHNRVRWQFDGLYAEKMLSLSFTKWKSIPWERPEVCPINLHLLAAEFRKTMPVKTEAEVKPLSLTTETLDELVEQAEAWLKRIGKDKR